MKKLYMAFALIVAAAGLRAQELELNYLSTYRTMLFDEAAAEIVTYDKDAKRLYFTNASDNSLKILDFSNPSDLKLVNSIDLSSYGGGINSASAHNGFVACAIEASPKTEPGKVVFFDKDGAFVAEVTVGTLPDMLTFSPDGKLVITANEGEPSNDYMTDPEGSVSIIDVSGGINAVNQSNVTTLTFDGINLTGDVRIFGQYEGPKTADDLFFSEYAEGSSNHKYMEIYNGTGQEVSLADYAFPNSSNGSDGNWEFWQEFPDTAVVAAGDVYIIAHPSADSSIIAKADLLFTYLSNGDDGFALVKGGTWDDADMDSRVDPGEMTGFTIIDRIGDWGPDPGSGWDVGDTANGTQDHTLIRKGNITSGNEDWDASRGTDDATSEWIVMPKDDWNGLGAHAITEMELKKASQAQDLEPEYVAVSDDSRTAYVTLQENNALAVINLETKTVGGIVGLGYKDHNALGNGLDASDRDDAVNIANWPVYGMYMPDAITYYGTNSKGYILSANEGDARDYDAYAEEERIKDLTLDATAFPNASDLQKNEQIGRLTVTTSQGDTDNDGDFDELYAFGARSFSVWNAADGSLIWDSGDEFEQKLSTIYPNDFNSTNDENGSFDNRSDNKGPEPEAIEIASLNGKDYALIGLERIGGIMVYDLSNPEMPSYVTYTNNRDFDVVNASINGESNDSIGDLGVEDILFIGTDVSPDGKAYVITSNEISGTISVFEMTETTNSIKDLTANSALKAYPNPLSGNTLQLNVAGDYEVLDVQGRVVASFSNTQTLDMTEVSKGSYFIRSSDGRTLPFIRL